MGIQPHTHTLAIRGLRLPAHQRKATEEAASLTNKTAGNGAPPRPASSYPRSKRKTKG